MKKYIYRFSAFLAAVCWCLTCSGCWDYKGLDQLTIVAGFALDQSPEGGYLLSLEVIDADSVESQSAASSKLIQSEGKTVADAVYQIGTQFYNNVYFGNAEILILSRPLVEEKGLYDIIDSLLRDNGIRDNLTILISGEKTAHELITPKEEATMII